MVLFHHFETYFCSKVCYLTYKKKLKNCDGTLLTVVEFMLLLLLLL